MGSKSGIVNHYNVDKYRYFNSFTYTVSSGSLFYLWYQNNRNKYLADENEGIPIKAVSDYFYENLQLKAFFSDLYSDADDYFENHFMKLNNISNKNQQVDLIAKTTFEIPYLHLKVPMVDFLKSLYKQNPPYQKNELLLFYEIAGRFKTDFFEYYLKETYNNIPEDKKRVFVLIITEELKLFRAKYSNFEISKWEDVISLLNADNKKAEICGNANDLTMRIPWRIPVKKKDVIKNSSNYKNNGEYYTLNLKSDYYKESIKGSPDIEGIIFLMKGHSTKDSSDNGGEIIVDGKKITEKDYIEYIYPKLKSELEKKKFKIIDDAQKEKYRIELGDKQYDEKEYVKKILENDVKTINMERKVKGLPPLPFSTIIIHVDKRNKPGTHIYCKSGDKAGSAELAEKIVESLNNKAKTDQRLSKASLMQNTNAIERKKVFMNALCELNILFSFIESFNLPDESERSMFEVDNFLEIWSEAIANGVKKFHEEKR